METSENTVSATVISHADYRCKGDVFVVGWKPSQLNSDSNSMMGSRSAKRRPRIEADHGPTLHRTACLYTRVCSRLPRGKCFWSARPLQPSYGARTGLCLSRYYCCGNWGLTREAVDSPRTRDVGWKARIDGAACTTRRQFALALYRPAYDAFLPHYDQSGCNVLRVLTRGCSNEWIVDTSNGCISSRVWSTSSPIN